MGIQMWGWGQRYLNNWGRAKIMFPHLVKILIPIISLCILFYRQVKMEFKLKHEDYKDI